MTATHPVVGIALAGVLSVSACTEHRPVTAGPNEASQIASAQGGSGIQTEEAGEKVRPNVTAADVALGIVGGVVLVVGGILYVLSGFQY